MATPGRDNPEAGRKALRPIDEARCLVHDGGEAAATDTASRFHGLRDSHPAALCSTRSSPPCDRSSPCPFCALCASWRPSSDFASRTWPRESSAATAAATPAAFPITSPHELLVGSTSDVAAPAGAEISRPYLVLHAVPIRVRLLLSLPLLRLLRLLAAELRLRLAYLASWIFRGCSRGHTGTQPIRPNPRGPRSRVSEFSARFRVFRVFRGPS